jgi:hypothetical protein
MERWSKVRTLSLVVLLGLASAACSSTAANSMWGPEQQAASQACESQGGVYLTGENYCAFGEGVK